MKQHLADLNLAQFTHSALFLKMRQRNVQLLGILISFTSSNQVCTKMRYCGLPKDSPLPIYLSVGSEYLSKLRRTYRDSISQKYLKNTYPYLEIVDEITAMKVYFQ